MATWPLNKTTITNNGLMMINSARSGFGGITITKAEVGKTFSTLEVLPSLLAIPSPVGNPIILDRYYDGSGSVIRIELTNEGILIPFPMCQVGIYASQASVNNGAECLYMISQCDIPADLIPVESETFVRLRYKMYIQHTQEDNIVFNINESSLPIASALNLGGIRVGERLSIDEEGVLSADKASGIELSETMPVDMLAGNFWFEIL